MLCRARWGITSVQVNGQEVAELKDCENKPSKTLWKHLGSLLGSLCSNSLTYLRSVGSAAGRGLFWRERSPQGRAPNSDYPSEPRQLNFDKFTLGCNEGVLILLSLIALTLPQGKHPCPQSLCGETSSMSWACGKSFTSKCERQKGQLTLPYPVRPALLSSSETI